ncbi:MAG: mono/diheme cytochrome c family protein [Patiriisocius sp.]|jgi:mono/diheme cytochrome c family protein
MTKNRIHYTAFIAILMISCNNTNKKDTAPSTLATTEEITQSPLEKSIERGAKVYRNICAQCHRPNGKGIAKNFPPLAGSNWLTAKRLESIKSVKYGLRGEIVVNGEPYDGVMNPMGLSNKQVADVMNYTMNSWGNEQKDMVTVQEVNSVKK